MGCHFHLSFTGIDGCIVLSEVGFSGIEEVTSDGDVGIDVLGTLVDGCVVFSVTLVDE